MKTLLRYTTLLSLFCTISFSLNAQCIPDTTIPEGFQKTLDDGCIGQMYDDTLHFAFGDSITFQFGPNTLVRKMDSVAFTGSSFVPLGLTLDCVNLLCKFATDSTKLVYGCIRIHGTPTTASTQDSIELEYDAHYISGNGNPNTSGRSENVGLLIGPFGGWSWNRNVDTVDFTSTSASATAWAWTFGDGTTSAVQNPTHIYTTGGTYEACLAVTDPCGTDTTCDSILICGPVGANFTYTIVDDTVFFTSTSTGSVRFLRWDMDVPGPPSFGSTPFEVYNTSGTYDVCLIAIDSCFNRDTLCQPVTILITEIEETLNESVEIFPVPASDKLSIRGIIPGTELVVMDFYGRQLLDEISEGVQAELKLELLKPGVYLLRIKQGDQQITRKFIKSE